MDPAPGKRAARMRLSALCGMAAPITFIGTVLILGFLQPAYDPVTQLMSELGVPGSPYAAVMDLAGLFLTGLLLILFTLAIHAAFGDHRGGTIGTFLIAVVGLTFIGMAFFPCDAGCVPVTTAGQLHLLLGMAGILVTAASAFLLAYAMREAGGWNRYWQYSILTGTVVLLMVLLTPRVSEIPGLWQRMIAGVAFFWTEVMALRLYLWSTRASHNPRRNGTGDPEDLS